MWPFSEKARPKVHFSSIGPYSLDSSINGIRGLREASAQEYAVFGRSFVDEKIFHAPSVQFLGFQWEVMLGTVHGQIYKIATYYETSVKQNANEVAHRTLTHCSNTLGKPAEQQSGLFVWDTADGNVVLQTAEVSGRFTINLFLTSRNVRSFQRLR